MRVLHVVPSLSPEWGGPVGVVRHLVRHLEGVGVDYAILSATGPRVGAPSGDLDGSRLHLMRAGALDRAFSGFAPRSTGAAVRAVRSCDLVHIHQLWHFPGLAAAAAATALRRPLVVSPHGELAPRAMEHKAVRKRVYLSLVQRPILRRASAIHAITATEVRQVRDVARHDRVRLIPNGVDATEFERLPTRSRFEKRYPALRGKRVVLYLGRLHPIKGLDLLVDAFARLRRDRPDVALVLAGPDEEGHRAELTAGLRTVGALDQTVFTGMLAGDERLAALAAADVFVLPSYSEGFSLGLLEGMAAGIPVVATDRCNFPEVDAAAAGFIVPPDAGQLHAALDRVLAEPRASAEMGTRGRALVRERYDWTRIAAEMKELYAMVAGKGS